MTNAATSLFARAQAVIPGGVDSPVRSFASVGGTPFTVVRGEGALRLDVEGSRLPRLRPVLGRVAPRPRPPDVVASAITRAAAVGTTFGAPTAGEVRAGRGHLRAGARLREGPAGVVGDRGGDERGAAGPRRHRARPDREVRRLLPRPRRRAAGRRGQRGGHARACRARPACRPRRWPTPSSSPTTWSPSSTTRGLRDRRAGGRQHGPGRRRRRGSSRACGPPATGPARCWCSTR